MPLLYVEPGVRVTQKTCPCASMAVVSRPPTGGWMTQGAAGKIRTVMVLVAAGLMSTFAFAAAAPFLIHDCGNIHPRPRPCDGAANITRFTSLYLEVVVTISGHFPADGVDPNSIVATIKKGAGTPVTMFGPNQVWAPGYSGRMTAQFTDSGKWGYGAYALPAAPLDPQGDYLVTVTAQTMTPYGPITRPTTRAS